MPTARLAVIATAAVLAACSSAPPETTSATVQPAAETVPLPTSAPSPAAAAAPARAAAPQAQPLAVAPTRTDPPAAPGSLLASRGAPAPAAPAANSLFQNASSSSLPGVAQPPAPGAVGGMELRGALPAAAEPSPAGALPGVAEPPIRAGAAPVGATPPPDARYGANPPSAGALRGSWRLRTTSSNVSCTIAVSPADQLAAGAVSSQKECLAYGAVNRFELRGRDLVLIDPFGETATLQPLGSYWQGRGKGGEGIILQR